MGWFSRVLAVAFLLAFAGSAAAWWKKYPVPVKERPDWVVEKSPAQNFTVPSEDISQGIYHLLVDTQVLAREDEDPQYFYHYARHIVNQTGVEQSAQIDIDYNPDYQSLRLHEVAVWRNGEKIDKLPNARMNLINREKELDNLLYSGEQTLHLVLDDIGVGDTLEYSYTIEGYNPIYEGIFAFGHYTEWAIPVHQLAVMVHWLKPQTLYYKVTDIGAVVRTAPFKNGTSYIVEKREIKGQTAEEDTPHWFNPYGIVRFSESPSWRSVADWARPLMESGIGTGPEIQKIAANIARTAVDRADRIAKALQYVQAEVRYFGIEIGGNSHRPSSAEETLARRYGDCKDKTVLLISILRALGVEAYAALVNSYMNRELRDALPAINIFDHVIVAVFHEGKLYWLDPARQYQYGSLSSIHQPDYGYALVLKPGASALTEARPLHQAYSGNELHEIFDLTAGPAAPVVYTAQTTVTGLSAEKLRDNLANSGQSSAQKDYLMFYKRFYPSIEAVETTKFRDWPELNEMEVEEKYSIANIWEENTKEKKHYAWFHAHSITPYLQTVKAGQRRHPLALQHPVNIRQFIEVRLHDYRWNFEDEDFTEGNPFFSFSKTVRFDEASKKLLLEYNYTSKTDFVPPEEIDDYIEAYQTVEEQSRYGLFMTTPAVASGSAGSAGSAGGVKAEPNVSLYAVLFYVCAVGLIFVAWRVHQESRPFKGEMVYFPVSLPKFMIMGICTLGIYSFYWAYRNWLYVKKRDGSNIMPLARSLLLPFWYYPLYEELRRDNAQRFQQPRLPASAVAALSAAAFFAAALAANFSGVALIPTIVGLALLLPLANYINFANQANRPALRHNSKWSPRHFFLMMVSMPVLLFLLGSETGLTPGERVVEGKALLSHNIKFLQRKGVVRPGDEIRYFYSDAFISMRDDGNGFSNRHVFSYWKDEGKFFLESAGFDEIKDIKVIWGKWNSDTVVEVVRQDNSRFPLYVSTAWKKDKLFVNSLLEQWQQQRPQGSEQVTMHDEG